MRRKPHEIDFEIEQQDAYAAIRLRIGKTVPLSARYTFGQQATLVPIIDDQATLLFPNGAKLENVPLRDLVDDSRYWKS